jgi:hypothetical protein
MRRIKIVVECVLVIVLALPLLPGPGSLIVAEAIAVLEREFAWVRRLMDRVTHTGAKAAPGSRRPKPIPHPV